MTMVVTEPCFGCKFADCVTVCPAECFYEGESMLFIHPEECIDCGACVPECPPQAIFHESDVPEKWRRSVRISRRKRSRFAAVVEGRRTTTGNSSWHLALNPPKDAGGSRTHCMRFCRPPPRRVTSASDRQERHLPSLKSSRPAFPSPLEGAGGRRRMSGTDRHSSLHTRHVDDTPLSPEGEGRKKSRNLLPCSTAQPMFQPYHGTSPRRWVIMRVWKLSGR